jgi:hypothetical protein
MEISRWQAPQARSHRFAYPKEIAPRMGCWKAFRDPCRGRSLVVDLGPVAARLRRLPPANLRHASGVLDSIYASVFGSFRSVIRCLRTL